MALRTLAAREEPARPDSIGDEVDTLYRHTPSIVLANACGAIVVAVGLQARAGTRAMLGWAGAVILLSALRLYASSRRRSAPRANEVSWARLFIAGSFGAGVLWGTCPFVLANPSSAEPALLLTFVIGGLVAGAAGTLACHLPAFFAFSVPALVPTAAKLAHEPGATPRLMSLMVIVYGISMFAVAKNVNRALRSAFSLRSLNEKLLADQAGVNRLLEGNNRDLDQRVMERTAELRAFAERQREAADLGCRALTDDNVEHVAARAASALRRTLGLDAASVFELLPDGKTLAQRTADGAVQELVVLDVGRSAVAARRTDGVVRSELCVAALEEALVTTDTRAASEYAEDPLVGPFELKSFICAALAAEGGPLGVVFVGSRRERVFGRDDTSYVQIVANVVAGSIAQRRSETMRRRGQQLEAMGRIASGVAHEINTPMQFIAHSASFVEDGLREVERVYLAHERYIDSLEGEPGHAARVAALRAVRESSHMRYLLQTIPKSLERIGLGIARVSETLRAMRRFDGGSSVSKHTDVNELIRSAAIITNHLVEHVAHVELSLGELPKITAHPGELFQVFQNLITNAVDAIREKYGRESRGVIRLSSACEDGRVVVLVEDDGCGIPKAHLPRVFEPFYTTKDEKHGSGQGLAIARDVIERGHGGVISVRSEVGRGTEFRIEIPNDVIAPVSWRSVLLAKDVTSLVPVAEDSAIRRIS